VTVTRILVPTDFSEHSKRALEWAKHLAEAFGASIHLFTVVPDPFVLPEPGRWYVPPPKGYVEGLRADADAHLGNLLTQADRTRFRVESAVAFGDPAREILDYAMHAGIDVIVMGTHGRTGLARVLLGSVAQRVVGAAHCPVLTVHRDDPVH